MSNQDTFSLVDDGQQGTFVEPNANVGDSNQNDVPIDSIQGETESSTPTINSRRLLSDVWNHFKRQMVDEKWKAICNYSTKSLLGDTKHNTSHLRSHFKSCKLRTTRDIRQSFLKTHKDGGETVVVGNYVFNQQTTRDALRKIIILHEYPMSMVDHIGFKEFCDVVQPLFKVISRNTLKKIL